MQRAAQRGRAAAHGVIMANTDYSALLELLQTLDAASGVDPDELLLYLQGFKDSFVKLLNYKVRTWCRRAAAAADVDAHDLSSSWMVMACLSTRGRRGGADGQWLPVVALLQRVLELRAQRCSKRYGRCVAAPPFPPLDACRAPAPSHAGRWQSCGR